MSAVRGEPSERQLLTIDLIVASEADEAKVIGWHDELEGPLVLRKDGRWQAILPNGRIRTLAKSFDG